MYIDEFLGCMRLGGELEIDSMYVYVDTLGRQEYPFIKIKIKILVP